MSTPIRHQSGTSLKNTSELDSNFSIYTNSSISRKHPPGFSGFKRVSVQGVVDSMFDFNAAGGKKEDTDPNSLFLLLQDKILASFTGIGFHDMIEETNVIVRKWMIHTNTESATTDLNVLFKTGIMTMAIKINTMQNDILASKLADTWSLFLSNVIPNILVFVIN